MPRWRASPTAREPGATSNAIPNASILSGNGISGGGALQNSSAYTSVLTGGITLASNATTTSIVTAGTGNILETGAITDGGNGLNASLTKGGSGTLFLTGNSNYGGGTTISAGTLQIGYGGTSGNILGSVSNNGALVFNRPDAAGFYFSGNISGAGSVTQAASFGTLALNGNNSYTGDDRQLGRHLEHGRPGLGGHLLDPGRHQRVLAIGLLRGGCGGHGYQSSLTGNAHFGRK